MKKDITVLFCFIDDFYKMIQKEIKNHQISSKEKQKNPTRIPGLTESEIMTIMLMFQESLCRNFKYFYKSFLQSYRPEFPKMPSYERFITLMPRVLYLLTILLCCILRKNSKIAYMDSTSINVCHPKRIRSNKVFKGFAKLGKSTKGNVDDRAVAPQMTADMTGLLFADKGYISNPLFLKLLARGLKLITGIKQNMKNILMNWNEKILLRKRSLVETVFDYLKNKFMLEHSRHRSLFNMLIHIVSTLVAYQLKPTKPHISMNFAIS